MILKHELMRNRFRSNLKCFYMNILIDKNHSVETKNISHIFVHLFNKT